MKVIFCFICMILSSLCFADESGEGWLSDSTSKFGGSPLPESSICEVAGSLVDEIIAKNLLLKDFVEITPKTAKKYANSKCSIEFKKHTYLVRAAFGNKGTGGYSVYVNGASLLVFHGSLGEVSRVGKSALIVCTDQAVEKVFLNIGSAD